MEQHDATESRYREVHVLGLVMDEGPLTEPEITARLYPDGTTYGRGSRKRQSVPKDRKSIRAKLTALVDKGHLQREKGGRYRVHPDLGSVWVVYVGSERGYVGIYGASLQPISLSGGATAGPALRILEHVGEAQRLPSHELVLKPCLDALADLVASVDERAREPRALVIGLPAALSVDNCRVQGEAPSGWTAPDMPTIEEIVEQKWRSVRRQSRPDGVAVPDLPRRADGTLALTADADVVLDTLGAMYDLSRIDVDAPDPRRARVVLGVKHSVSIRSTVVTRGPPDLHVDREHRRCAGRRRDTVYRGAFGDTIGLGHSIALIIRAGRQTRDRADDGEPTEDITQYHDRRVADDRPCSCGTLDPPHLNQVASWHTVQERLAEAGVSTGPDDVWDGINREIYEVTPTGIQARMILEETGRLLAYALDNGVRLYDPEAILVTGKMAFNDTFWTTVKLTSEVARKSARRYLGRAADIPGDDVTRPIGPRGAAWLGFDTWVFPALLTALDPMRHH